MHRPFRFAPPPPGTYAVLRPRLLQPLARRFDVRLITIEAGAGLGKTTLLAQALAENMLSARGRDAWLTCEASDASPSLLLAGLLRAVGDAGDGPDPPTIRRLCETVWAAAPEQVCLVLDDVHALEPGSPGATVLRQVLDDLPENGHLVLAGRSLPALATSRLRLDNRAVALTEEDLRLDDAETAALAGGHGVAPAALRQAGGWPALAELQARAGGTDARRYAWEEVVALLPPAERDGFLLLVAVGEVDADALAAASDVSFDRERLAGLPLVSGDDAGGLRAHPLWEELLSDHIDRAFTASARRRLAEVLVERGDHGPAFELLASTAAWDRALEALFDACNDQRRPPWADQMARWARLVPGDLHDRPELRYATAMIERATDPWSERARDDFAAAIRGFRERDDVVRELIAAIRAAHAAWLRCDRDALDRFYDRGIEMRRQGLPVDAITAINRAVRADVDGDVAVILDRCDELVDLEPRLRHFRGLLRAFAHLAAGDADAAVPHAAEAALEAAPVWPAAGTGWAALVPIVTAWARGDTGAVVDEPPGDPGPRQSLAERVPPLAMAAIVAAHLGDVDRAEMLLRELDGLVPHAGNRDLVAGFRAVAGAAVRVAQGDEDTASRELAVLLDGRALDAGGAGRAVLWFPTLPWLLYEPARTMLDARPSGPSRRRMLGLCRALSAARGGEWARPDGLDDAGLLLAALPAPLATELLVHAAANGAPARPTIARLAELAPAATRHALRSQAGSAATREAARSLLAAVPIPPPHHVRIEVLGPARLLVDGKPVDNPHWRRQRVRQLVCALVAERQIRRARLGAMLWPDFDEAAVSANLRQTLSYVQALLEPGRGRGDAPWFLTQEAGVLRLQGGEHLSIDAWDVEASLDRAAAAASTGVASLELAELLATLPCWRGDYLEDVAGEEWAEPRREAFRNRFVAGALRAGDLLVAGGRPADAVAAAVAARTADPWCEAAFRLEATAHLVAGDQSAARAALAAGLRRLDELGVPPDAATLELRRRVHGGN